MGPAGGERNTCAACPFLRRMRRPVVANRQIFPSVSQWMNLFERCSCSCQGKCADEPDRQAGACLRVAQAAPADVRRQRENNG